VPAAGVGQICWSPFAQGVLTGKYLPGAPPLQDPRATGVEAEEMSWLLRDEVLTPVQDYAELCRQAGYTPASVALAWVHQNENVSAREVGVLQPADGLQLQSDFHPDPFPSKPIFDLASG